MIRDRDEFEVEIPAGRVSLTGQLCIPDQPTGIVVFADGPGSERHSPRNQEIARAFVAQGFATLVFDLLTADEDGDRHARFDVHLLANRLVNALEWIAHQPHLEAMPIGLFGASTAAASALIAATRMRSVAAVVSRAGRPDLAHEALPQVSAPLLLIVGSHDHEVLELNRRALRQINAPAKLHIVEGASHEFDEPGTLGEVMVAATAWFRKHLCAPTMHEQFGSAWES